MNYFELPKSEYRLCDPPEVWVDVSSECIVIGHGQGGNDHGIAIPYRNPMNQGAMPLLYLHKEHYENYRLRKVQLCERSTSLQWAFIVERKQP